MMKNIRYKLIVSAIVLLYAVILYFSPISCLFYEATGIKCPGCGMTRALLAAVRLDFRGAWECHRMFATGTCHFLQVFRRGLEGVVQNICNY